jgi:hypothetical protein
LHWSFPPAQVFVLSCKEIVGKSGAAGKGGGLGFFRKPSRPLPRSAAPKASSTTAARGDLSLARRARIGGGFS